MDDSGLKQAEVAAARVTSREMENFTVLAPFVPKAIRADMRAVYSFCRGADDIADAGGDEASRAAALRELGVWREQLRRCVGPVIAVDAPLPPVFVALGATIRRHEIPVALFEELLDAFEQDQRVRRVSTWEDLIAYSKKSANPVGRICLWLAGHRWEVQSERPDARMSMSDSVCTALQLANFWQDVRRDLLDLDRVYLPFKETGLSGETLREWALESPTSERREKFAEVLKPLVARTRALMRSAEMLPTMTAPWLGRCIRLFRAGGTTVLDRVETGGYGTLWVRPRVGKVTKTWLVVRERLGLG